MKKEKKRILAVTVVSALLLIATVSIGSATVNKQASVRVNETSPASSGLFNFSFNGTILKTILNVLNMVNDTLSNATNIIDEVIIPIVSTIINIIESILEMPIFNPEAE